MMMWYGNNGWGWGGWILMTIVMVLFWAAVITAVVLAIRYVASPRATASGPPGSWQPRAQDLLSERFARGEIDDDEYRNRLALRREPR
jgi:putative membrane protein